VGRDNPCAYLAFEPAARPRQRAPTLAPAPGAGADATCDAEGDAPVSDLTARPFFFVHIMKTGGATLRQHIYANHEPGAVYPVPKHDDMEWAMLVDSILGLPPERRAALRGYMGHYPFMVTQLLGVDPVTFTIVRDPVERTISYLKHCKRYHDHHEAMSLEEIYEDAFYFPCFIHNHQAKIFSMGEGDRLESYMDVVDVDDQRLEIAKANLALVDVVGVHDHYDEFLDELRARFGWRFGQAGNRRVSREPWAVSLALRDRIATDNAADVAFYEHALQLREQRRRPRTSG
jgi:hypothetical protein